MDNVERIEAERDAALDRVAGLEVELRLVVAALDKARSELAAMRKEKSAPWMQSE